MSGVSFERLPPERRIAAPTAASAGSCCCCCCCCLHTIGSIVGALSARTPKPKDASVPTAVIGGGEAAPRYSVRKEYWVTLMVLSIVAFPLFCMAADWRVERAEEWMLMYAIFLPGIQLATTVVVGVRNTFSKRPGQQERIRHLGSITLRAFLGTMIGIGVMLPFFLR
jgi:hypothetical protein